MARLRLVEVEYNVCHKGDYVYSETAHCPDCDSEFDPNRDEKIAESQMNICHKRDYLYEGFSCWDCKDEFNPERDEKISPPLIIVVDAPYPVYEKKKLCHCPRCGNLYSLEVKDLVKRANCGQCKKVLFSKAELKRMMRGKSTLTTEASELDRAILNISGSANTPALSYRCSFCSFEDTLHFWCPLCRSEGTRETGDQSGLSQRLYTVWSRTFNTLESVEDHTIPEDLNVKREGKFWDR